MSQDPPTVIPTSSANFQPIFNAALKAYEKKTKNDLLAHPLATQLQACDSPDDILAILQDRVKQLDKSRSERLSRWLNPTINVLFAFSAALGAGVGLVGPIQSTRPRHPLHHTKFTGLLACERDLCWCWGPVLGENPPQSLYGSHSNAELVTGSQGC
jgi:hypothetical protein